jgi:nickel-dependent lactate racemase
VPIGSRLAFGETGLKVELPADRTTVVEPIFQPGAADPVAVLHEALRRPVSGARLREMVRPGQTVAVAVCDGTRPQPRALMIPAVLDELDGVVRPEDVTILVATGTHRANTPAELASMLGDQVPDTVRVVNHDARDDDALVWCGRFGDDVPVWLNKHWVAADVRITTGFVEPHFFAGFSGGPKLVAPGLAGMETVLTLHDACRVGHRMATWGVTEGNPIHDDVRAIAAGTGVDFAFDVILNRDQQIVAAFAGELFAMHAAARERVRTLAMRPVPELYDVVVTTNAGYPLDQNLYQAVKGMADQWQIQVQAKIQAAARVFVHSPYLDDTDLRAAHLEPTNDVAATVAAELAATGPHARVCVLPEGPQTIAYPQQPPAG